jgi:hypothetical protein
MRYGIGIILVIVFVIIASVFLLGRGNNSGSNTSELSRATRIADYADKDSTRISWTMQGRIVGEDQFKSVRVTVTRQTRTVEVLSGYEERTEKKAEYANTPAAYQTFARALDVASFGRERTVKCKSS